MEERELPKFFVLSDTGDLHTHDVETLSNSVLLQNFSSSSKSPIKKSASKSFLSQFSSNLFGTGGSSEVKEIRTPKSISANKKSFNQSQSILENLSPSHGDSLAYNGSEILWDQSNHYLVNDDEIQSINTGQGQILNEGDVNKVNSPKSSEIIDNYVLSSTNNTEFVVFDQEVPKSEPQIDFIPSSDMVNALDAKVDSTTDVVDSSNIQDNPQTADRITDTSNNAAIIDTSSELKSLPQYLESELAVNEDTIELNRNSITTINEADESIDMIAMANICSDESNLEPSILESGTNETEILQLHETLEGPDINDTAAILDAIDNVSTSEVPVNEEVDISVNEETFSAGDPLSEKESVQFIASEETVNESNDINDVMADPIIDQPEVIQNDDLLTDDKVIIDESIFTQEVAEEDNSNSGELIENTNEITPLSSAISQSPLDTVIIEDDTVQDEQPISHEIIESTPFPSVESNVNDEPENEQGPLILDNTEHASDIPVQINESEEAKDFVDPSLIIEKSELFHENNQSDNDSTSTQGKIVDEPLNEFVSNDNQDNLVADETLLTDETPIITETSVLSNDPIPQTNDVTEFDVQAFVSDSAETPSNEYVSSEDVTQMEPIVDNNTDSNTGEQVELSKNDSIDQNVLEKANDLEVDLLSDDKECFTDIAVIETVDESTSAANNNYGQSIETVKEAEEQMYGTGGDEVENDQSNLVQTDIVTVGEPTIELDPTDQPNQITEYLNPESLIDEPTDDAEVVSQVNETEDVWLSVVEPTLDNDTGSTIIVPTELPITSNDQMEVEGIQGQDESTDVYDQSLILLAQDSTPQVDELESNDQDMIDVQGESQQSKDLIANELNNEQNNEQSTTELEPVEVSQLTLDDSTITEEVDKSSSERINPVMDAVSITVNTEEVDGIQLIEHSTQVSTIDETPIDKINSFVEFQSNEPSNIDIEGMNDEIAIVEPVFEQSEEKLLGTVNNELTDTSEKHSLGYEDAFNDEYNDFPTEIESETVLSDETVTAATQLIVESVSSQVTEELPSCEETTTTINDMNLASISNPDDSIEELVPVAETVLTVTSSDEENNMRVFPDVGSEAVETTESNCVSSEQPPSIVSVDNEILETPVNQEHLESEFLLSDQPENIVVNDSSLVETDSEIENNQLSLNIHHSNVDLSETSQEQSVHNVHADSSIPEVADTTDTHGVHVIPYDSGEECTTLDIQSSEEIQLPIAETSINDENASDTEIQKDVIGSFQLNDDVNTETLPESTLELTVDNEQNSEFNTFSAAEISLITVSDNNDKQVVEVEDESPLDSNCIHEIISETNDQELNETSQGIVDLMNYVASKSDDDFNENTAEDVLTAPVEECSADNNVTENAASSYEADFVSETSHDNEDNVGDKNAILEASTVEALSELPIEIAIATFDEQQYDNEVFSEETIEIAVTSVNEEYQDNVALSEQPIEIAGTTFVDDDEVISEQPIEMAGTTLIEVDEVISEQIKEIAGTTFVEEQHYNDVIIEQPIEMAGTTLVEVVEVITEQIIEITGTTFVEEPQYNDVISEQPIEMTGKTFVDDDEVISDQPIEMVGTTLVEEDEVISEQPIEIAGTTLVEEDQQPIEVDITTLDEQLYDNEDFIEQPIEVDITTLDEQQYDNEGFDEQPIEIAGTSVDEEQQGNVLLGEHPIESNNVPLLAPVAVPESCAGANDMDQTVISNDFNSYPSTELKYDNDLVDDIMVDEVRESPQIEPTIQTEESAAIEAVPFLSVENSSSADGNLIDEVDPRVTQVAAQEVTTENAAIEYDSEQADTIVDIMDQDNATKGTIDANSDLEENYDITNESIPLDKPDTGNNTAAAANDETNEEEPVVSDSDFLDNSPVLQSEGNESDFILPLSSYNEVTYDNKETDNAKELDINNSIPSPIPSVAGEPESDEQYYDEFESESTAECENTNIEASFDPTTTNEDAIISSNVDVSNLVTPEQEVSNNVFTEYSELPNDQETTDYHSSSQLEDKLEIYQTAEVLIDSTPDVTSDGVDVITGLDEGDDNILENTENQYDEEVYDDDYDDGFEADTQQINIPLLVENAHNEPKEESSIAVVETDSLIQEAVQACTDEILDSVITDAVTDLPVDNHDHAPTDNTNEIVCEPLETPQNDIEYPGSIDPELFLSVTAVGDTPPLTMNVESSLTIDDEVFNLSIDVEGDSPFAGKQHSSDETGYYTSSYEDSVVNQDYDSIINSNANNNTDSEEVPTSTNRLPSDLNLTISISPVKSNKDLAFLSPLSEEGNDRINIPGLEAEVSQQISQFLIKQMELLKMKQIEMERDEREAERRGLSRSVSIQNTPRTRTYSTMSSVVTQLESLLELPGDYKDVRSDKRKKSSPSMNDRRLHSRSNKYENPTEVHSDLSAEHTPDKLRLVESDISNSGTNSSNSPRGSFLIDISSYQPIVDCVKEEEKESEVQKTSVTTDLVQNAVISELPDSSESLASSVPVGSSNNMMNEDTHDDGKSFDSLTTEEFDHNVNDPEALTNPIIISPPNIIMSSSMPGLKWYSLAGEEANHVRQQDQLLKKTKYHKSMQQLPTLKPSHPRDRIVLSNLNKGNKTRVSRDIDKYKSKKSGNDKVIPTSDLSTHEREIEANIRLRKPIELKDIPEEAYANPESLKKALLKTFGDNDDFLDEILDDSSDGSNPRTNESPPMPYDSHLVSETVLKPYNKLNNEIIHKEIIRDSIRHASTSMSEINMTSSPSNPLPLPLPSHNNSVNADTPPRKIHELKPILSKQQLLVQTYLNAFNTKGFISSVDKESIMNIADVKKTLPHLHKMTLSSHISRQHQYHDYNHGKNSKNAKLSSKPDSSKQKQLNNHVVHDHSNANKYFRPELPSLLSASGKTATRRKTPTASFLNTSLLTDGTDIVSPRVTSRYAGNSTDSLSESVEPLQQTETSGPLLKVGDLGSLADDSQTKSTQQSTVRLGNIIKEIALAQPSVHKPGYRLSTIITKSEAAKLRSMI